MRGMQRVGLRRVRFRWGKGVRVSLWGRGLSHRFGICQALVGYCVVLFWDARQGIIVLTLRIGNYYYSAFILSSWPLSTIANAYTERQRARGGALGSEVD